jgi:hypothetical protein
MGRVREAGQPGTEGMSERLVPTSSHRFGFAAASASTFTQLERAAGDADEVIE